MDDTDISLMLRSFRHRIGAQPVETGIAELVNSSAVALWQSDMAVGTIASVDMRYAMSAAFSAAKNYPDATAIRFRHTHPPGMGMQGKTYLLSSFSRQDIDVNRSYRQAMDKMGGLRHLDLIATITFIDASAISKNINETNFQKIFRTKAYRLVPRP